MNEKKRAEEEILRFASFPRLNPNPVLELDLAGQITFSDEGAQKRFGNWAARISPPSCLRTWRSCSKAIAIKE